MDDIKKYSLSRDGNKFLAKNFRVREFACQDGSDTIYISRSLVLVLQYIRERVKGAVTISSAYRTKTHNKAVGGAANSQHLYGTAADIIVPGYTAQNLANIAREVMPTWGGVGLYNWGIHVDVRETKSDWKE